VTYQDLRELVVRNVCELRAVEFGDDKLRSTHQLFAAAGFTGKHRYWVSYGVSSAERVYVEEGQDFVGLEELE
jgi:hypothetical protein